MRQRKRERKAQLNWLDEIIVDNFAGGGGASTGIELATGRPVTIAINHDSDAILMHKTNHPYTQHYQASVWDVDPVEVCAGRPVGLAWFSPDCKHFSKAKGGKPVNKNIRGLAWIVLRWAGTVRPRVIILENVVEFQTWGPVRKEKPVKKLTGQTFKKWVEQLRQLGYVVEWKELVAADYGAPTTRKRFFLVARCDEQPIVWPEPSHAPANSAEVRAGIKKPWRSAAEIIDWTLPTPSIFASREEIKARYGLAAQRPLSPNTLRRIICGVDKFVIKSPTTSIDHNALQTVHLTKLKGKNLGGKSMEPVQTITAGGCHHGIVTTVLSQMVPEADLKKWPSIRTLLNTYCGYAFKDNEIILFLINKIWYFMADIGLRMLTPRELYQAQGFPADYKIEQDYTGTAYSKTKQVARCGNAVPPPFAKALVQANLPEWCNTEITTMEELEKEVAI